MKRFLMAAFAFSLLVLCQTAYAQNGAEIFEEPAAFSFESPCTETTWEFTGERRLIFTTRSIIAFYYGVATEEGTGNTVPFDGIRIDVFTPNGDSQQERARYGSNLNIYGEHRFAIGRIVCK